MCSSATVGVGLVEEAGISVCTEDHVAQSIDNAIRRVGSNIVKEKIDRACSVATVEQDWRAAMALIATKSLLSTARA